MHYENVPLSKLQLSALNTRKNRNAGQEDSGVAELAASIERDGLLNPPLVRRTLDEKYEVVAGQRRLLACKRVGLDPVPCQIRDELDDTNALALSLIENVHRADMSPCVFRSKSSTHSNPIRPLIPGQIVH
jgi:ParB family chromosome partitioning protein